MQVIRSSNSGVTVSMTNRELKIIRNALEEACRSVPSESFKTRTGKSTEDFRVLIASINSVISGQSNEQKSGSDVDFFMTNSDMLIINNGLNEVCHALRIDNFNQTIGADRNEVSPILKYINQQIDNQRSSRTS